MRSKHNYLRKSLQLGWRCYRAVSVLCFTGAIIFIGILHFNILRLFTYVELPNGLLLTQSLVHDIGRNGFVLNNADGRFILSARNAEIAWQNDYAFGIAGQVSTHTAKGDSFIYKRGWQEPIIYSAESDRRDYYMEYGLRQSLDYSPDMLRNEKYQACLKFSGSNECMLSALERYKRDVENGKAEPYVCNQKDRHETCHSYSRYETYLSLVKMKEYRRGW